MIPSVKTITLFSAILITGLSAGFFYAWEVSVIPGTKQVDDRSYLTVMQSVNRAVLNPAFFVVFMGSLILLVASAYLQYKVAVDLSFWLMAGATLVYAAGTFGVTAAGNVPMNEALDAQDLSTLDAAKLLAFRKFYESKWNQLHTIRTVFAVMSFVLSLLAAFVEKTNR